MISLPNITSSSTTVFVLAADNVNFENNEFKTKLASEKLDKGKSILGAPPKVEKKETRNPRIRRKTIKVLNKRSHIFVIIVELRDTLIQIAISG